MPRARLAATEHLMDEVRQLKKELVSGKAGEHTDAFQFAGQRTKTDLDDYNSVRSAVARHYATTECCD